MIVWIISEDWKRSKVLDFLNELLYNMEYNMKKDQKRIYPTPQYPFDVRVNSKGFVKNSSGWNSSDVGDALVLLTAILGVILIITIL